MAVAAISVMRDLSMSERQAGWKGGKLGRVDELPGRRSRSREGPLIPWPPKLPIDKSNEEIGMGCTGGSWEIGLPMYLAAMLDTLSSCKIIYQRKNFRHNQVDEQNNWNKYHKKNLKKKIKERESNEITHKLK